jgi:hypothetical protein
MGLFRGYVAMWLSDYVAKLSPYPSTSDPCIVECRYFFRNAIGRAPRKDHRARRQSCWVEWLAHDCRHYDRRDKRFAELHWHWSTNANAWDYARSLTTRGGLSFGALSLDGQWSLDENSSIRLHCVCTPLIRWSKTWTPRIANFHDLITV